MSTPSDPARPRHARRAWPHERVGAGGLAWSHEVVALIRDTDDSAAARARELGVPVIGDASLDSVRMSVQAHLPDCVVVSSYHRILPADLVQSCPIVNVHSAPLPWLRGRATVNRAIQRWLPGGAWISIHWLVAGLDAGGRCSRTLVPITDTLDRCDHVHGLNAHPERRRLAAAVRVSDQRRRRARLRTSRATYAARGVESDGGEIDWQQSTRQIDRLVRALVAPYPGAFTWLGLERLHVDRAVPLTTPRPTRGRILAAWSPGERLPTQWTC